MITLKYTHDEVNDREMAYAGDRTHDREGVIGRPNPWWPGGNTTNDCVGYQTERLGLRTGHETLAQLEAHPHLISISAFRAHYRFPEVPPEQIKAGHLVLSNWTGERDENGVLIAEHMEYCYSVGAGHSMLLIVGANTGPLPGVPKKNGVWRKTRPLDEHIRFGIVLPYPEHKPSPARRHEVAVVAAFVNDPKQVPPGLPLTTASGPGKDKGFEGHNYRVRVQTWGRINGFYPPPYIIDGIFGPRSRIVEAAAYKAATTKK